MWSDEKEMECRRKSAERNWKRCRISSNLSLVNCRKWNCKRHTAHKHQLLRQCRWMIKAIKIILLWLWWALTTNRNAGLALSNEIIMKPNKKNGNSAGKNTEEKCKQQQQWVHEKHGICFIAHGCVFRGPTERESFQLHLIYADCRWYKQHQNRHTMNDGVIMTNNADGENHYHWS